MTAPELEAGITRYFAQQHQDLAPCGRWEQLARHIARELSGTEAHEMEAHLRTCATCRQTLEDLFESQHAFVAPPVSAPLQFPRMVKLFAPALALAAGLIAFTVITRPQAGVDDRLTPKGLVASRNGAAAPGWSLDVAVKRGDRQFRAPSGSTLQTGDQLGFFYSAPTDGYLMVLYADDHSAPLRVFPARLGASAKISAGQNMRLDDGATLAEGQGCEWLIGLFTRAPLSAIEADALVHEMVARRQGCLLEVPTDAPADARIVVVKR